MLFHRALWPTIDQTLLTVNEMLMTLQAEGVGVERYQMTSHPQKFSQNPAVMQLVRGAADGRAAHHPGARGGDQGRGVSCADRNQDALEWSDCMKAQFIFFSGKGGVGKTSMACTHAVRYADAGKRTLIVTTDPASNLTDVFEQEIGHQITPIAGIPQLWAMEIDPDRGDSRCQT